MRILAAVGAVTLLLAGCQSADESMYNAERVCRESGLKVGTKAYQRCVDASYDNNRRQSEQATNAAVLGTVAGVVGGAAIASANNRRGYYYGRPYYYRCRGWGC